jgi:hypothetical protein
MMENEAIARRIVDAVLTDLKDRSGIGDAIDGTDEDIQQEIEGELTEKVRAILDEQKGE